MSSIMDDIEAQLSMMKNAYISLREKNPNHELLQLVELHEDSFGFNLKPEYVSRCVRDTDDHRIYGYIRYTQALKDALGGIQIKLIDTNPQSDF